MRQLSCFLLSLVLHVGIAYGAFYLISGVDKKPKQVVTRAVSFDLGMMLSSRPSPVVQPQQSQASKAKNSVARIAQPELKPQKVPEVVVKRPPVKKKPVVKPVKKAKPIVVKTQVKKKVVVKKKEIVKKKEVVKKKVVANTTSTKNKIKKPVQKQIASKQSVGIGLQQTNSLKNKGTVKASAGGQGSSNASQKASANAYRAGLARAIAGVAKRNYPRSAQRMRKQGTVRVRFSLGRDGSISNVSVAGSSGHSILDKAAVKSIKRLRKYKPPPANFPRVLTVPIRFNLR